MQEVRTQINRSEACFLLVLPPARLNADELAEAIVDIFPGIPAFGATTAGQITPGGYSTDTLLVISFPKRHFRCASMLINPLNPLGINDISSGARKLASQFPKTAQWNRFALIFADAMSQQEDLLAAVLAVALNDMPVFGGSAGDGLVFEKTQVLHGGRFHTDAAVLLMIETDLNVAGIGFDHFLPSDRRMVVTDAIPEKRLVKELNGSPAAEEYARLVGCSVGDLSHRVFAENPVLVRNNAMYHVRAIHGVEPDGALSFLSAIDDGLMLTLGRGQEVLGSMESELDLRDELGQRPEFILGFDCYLRKLEIDQKNLTEKASSILRTNRVVGFNTFGEQHCGVHVNQTFVGVAFFKQAWNTFL